MLRRTVAFAYRQSLLIYINSHTLGAMTVSLDNTTSGLFSILRSFIRQRLLFLSCLLLPKMSEQPSRPTQKSVTSSVLPSVLTLRIYHENASFSAKSTTQLTSRGTDEIRCTCSRIPRLWIGADVGSQLRVPVPETPHRTTVLRFIFHTVTNREKANGLCVRSRESPSSEPFRQRMRKLLTDLTAMCEAEHPMDQSKPRSIAGPIPLSPFRTDSLDQNTVSEELRAKILSPLAASEVQGQGMGYVYIMRSNFDIDTFSVLKIGFSKYHPEHRAHELASCLSAPEVVAHTPLIPHAKRVESLIHTELVAKRRVRACGQCGSDHREWFAISHAESREIVIKWSRWILRQPYIDGKLSKEWQSYLQRQDFASANPEATMSKLWGDILDGFPHQKTDPAPEDQLAAYMNACYWAAVGDRVAGPMKGSFTSFQNDLRDCRENGRPLKFHDLMTAMERFISSNLNPDFSLDIIHVLERHCHIPLDPTPIPTSIQQAVNLLREREAWKAELRRQMESTKNLTTGAYSVSHPQQGITESPLGDATLLPVISLSAVQRLDGPARTWIGYNPTHEGFQMLQEAYQRGEWRGDVPQFKLPRSLRNMKAGTAQTGHQTTTQAAATDTNMKGADSDDTPASSEKPRRTKNKKAKARGMKVEVTTGPSGSMEQLAFSRVLDDDMIKEMEQMQKIMEFPLGMALLQKEKARLFRKFGVHVDGSYEAMSSSDEEEKEEEQENGVSGGGDDDDDMMDVDEPEEGCQKAPKCASSSVSRDDDMRRVVADLLALNRQKRATPHASEGPIFTKSKAKQWLESL